jgi:hypothetical protein
MRGSEPSGFRSIGGSFNPFHLTFFWNMTGHNHILSIKNTISVFLPESHFSKSLYLKIADLQSQ